MIPDHVSQRFWELTEVSPDGNCWIWRGRLDRHGYGAGMWVDGKRESAHRIAYRLLTGPIPAGMTIDHECFVPACVNPAHLRVMSNLDNARRQRSALRTSCASGHEFTAANSYIRPSGKRACRQCANRWARAYRIRKAS